MFGTVDIGLGCQPAVAKASPAAPRTFSREKIESIRARYDAALTTDENVKQWPLVDFFSAKAANSFEVRRILRMRSRYVVQNNPLAAGVVDTLALDTIGDGPRLQALFDDPAKNAAIEKAWIRWCRATNLMRRLRVAMMAKVTDGEVFFLKKNRKSQDDAVKLYHQDIETDQVQTVSPGFQSGYFVDGLELDELGLPTTYHVLKRHPGDLTNMRLHYGPLEHVRVPARYVIHWFHRYRPGQVRGIPELTPSLNLFESLRRIDKATLTAMEWAAVMSAVLETELAPDDADTAAVGAPWEYWDPDAGVVTTLPAGYKLKQLNPTQPGSTHKEFTGTQVAHAGRPVGMPYNVVTCNSSGYNFSSGRLDHLPYHRRVSIERTDAEEIVMDQFLADWLDEAVMVEDYFGGFDVPSLIEQVPHMWHWPKMDSIDPQKDAAADAQNLANGTSSRTGICGRMGTEYRQVRREQAAEIAFDRELAKEFDLPDNWADGLRPNMPTPTGADEDSEPKPGDKAKREAVAA
jgi:lambda family phage portal protein